MCLLSTRLSAIFNSPFSGITIENYDFELLFKHIKPNRLVTLFEGMLLEKKIILVHQNHGILAVIIE